MPRLFVQCVALIGVLVGIPVSAFAAQVDGVRVWADPAKTRAVLDLSSAVDYELFTLDNPARVVIDLDASDFEASTDLNAEHAGVIAGVRHGSPDGERLRVVFDLATSARPKSFLLAPTADYGHRLVIDLYPEASATAPREVKRADRPPQPERNVVVAVDAGHGGEDPGAIGKRGTREKDVVLQIAEKLKQAIDEEPGMRAVLTRTGDYYVPLHDRYQRARAARADLFVSIHADAFTNRDVRGSSVYVLSRRGASSEFARLLADRENRSDLVGGVSLEDKDDMLATVLLDLSQSATMGASDRVASEILGSLGRIGKVHKKSVGRANFVVLRSPDVPSVLVETAFISNPSEEKRLSHRDFQWQTARAIADGVSRYFRASPPPGTWLAANRTPTRHLVANGDTLGDIATRYAVSLAALRQANGINGDTIHPGTELLIPRG